MQYLLSFLGLRKTQVCQISSNRKMDWESRPWFGLNLALPNSIVIHKSHPHYPAWIPPFVKKGWMCGVCVTL